MQITYTDNSQPGFMCTPGFTKKMTNLEVQRINLAAPEQKCKHCSAIFNTVKKQLYIIAFPPFYLGGFYSRVQPKSLGIENMGDHRCSLIEPVEKSISEKLQSL